MVSIILLKLISSVDLFLYSKCTYVQSALQRELLNISLATLITSSLLATCISALTPPHAFHRFS